MLAGFPNLSPEFEVNLFLPHKLSRVVVLTINRGSVYMVFYGIGLGTRILLEFVHVLRIVIKLLPI